MKRQVQIYLPLSQGFARDVLLGIRRYFMAQSRWKIEEQLHPDLKRTPAEKGADGLLGTLGYFEQLGFSWSGKIPGVNTSSSDPSTTFANVVPDDWGIGAMGARSLLKEGFRRYAFVQYGGLAFDLKRQQGFRDVLEMEGMKLIHTFSLQGRDFDPQRQIDLQNWLQALPGETAILAGNDYTARMVILAARYVGRRVPGDLFVLGVDGDRVEFESCPVPLASILPDFINTGYQAAVRLVDIWEGKIKPTQQERILIPPLRVRMEHSATRQATPRRIDQERVLRFLEERIHHPIEVDDLGQLLGMSRRTVFRKFTQWFGQSPTTVIGQAKVERAKILLLETDWPIPIIAENVGIGAKTFGTTFKKFTGQTPRDFRKAASQ